MAPWAGFCSPVSIFWAPFSNRAAPSNFGCSPELSRNPLPREPVVLPTTINSRHHVAREPARNTEAAIKSLITQVVCSQKALRSSFTSSNRQSIIRHPNHVADPPQQRVRPLLPRPLGPLPGLPLRLRQQQPLPAHLF
jgi:hypothetical protein